MLFFTKNSAKSSFFRPLFVGFEAKFDQISSGEGVAVNSFSARGGVTF